MRSGIGHLTDRAKRFTSGSYAPRPARVRTVSHALSVRASRRRSLTDKSSGGRDRRCLSQASREFARVIWTRRTRFDPPPASLRRDLAVASFAREGGPASESEAWEIPFAPPRAGRAFIRGGQSGNPPSSGERERSVRRKVVTVSAQRINAPHATLGSCA